MVFDAIRNRSGRLTPAVSAADGRRLPACRGAPPRRGACVHPRREWQRRHPANCAAQLLRRGRCARQPGPDLFAVSGSCRARRRPVRHCAVGAGLVTCRPTRCWRPVRAPSFSPTRMRPRDLGAAGGCRRARTRTDALVLVDEAYVDFADADCLGLLAQHDNVLITRTLSKGYGLAGLRFGYAVAHPSMIEQMAKVKDSYNCDAIADCSGVCCARGPGVCAPAVGAREGRTDRA